MTINIRQLGLISYDEAWKLQQDLFNEALQVRNAFSAEKQQVVPQQNILFCEHPHVYTLGKSGRENNLLIAPSFLESIGATYVRTNRGGDITYHGPGQIVVYPILDLMQLNLSLKSYVETLEEAVIMLLKTYGIQASRLPGATGVWISAGTPAARKICAIGIRASRYITMHGLALNVNTDLRYFSYINPCGFKDKGVTSISAEIKRSISTEEVFPELRDWLVKGLTAQGGKA